MDIPDGQLDTSLPFVNPFRLLLSNRRPRSLALLRRSLRRSPPGPSRIYPRLSPVSFLSSSSPSVSTATTSCRTRHCRQLIIDTAFALLAPFDRVGFPFAPSASPDPPRVSPQSMRGHASSVPDGSNFSLTFFFKFSPHKNGIAYAWMYRGHFRSGGGHARGGRGTIGARGQRTEDSPQQMMARGFLAHRAL